VKCLLEFTEKFLQDYSIQSDFEQIFFFNVQTSTENQAADEQKLKQIYFLLKTLRKSSMKFPFFSLLISPPCNERFSQSIGKLSSKVQSSKSGRGARTFSFQNRIKIPRRKSEQNQQKEKRRKKRN
jgi:hypothetical protein